MTDRTHRWILTVTAGLVAACHGAVAPADPVAAPPSAPTMQPASPPAGQTPGYAFATPVAVRVGPIVAPAPAGTSGPGAIEPNGVPVDANTPLVAGTFVQLQYNSAWYEAQVLRAESGGRLRVRYVGWGAEWDETVDRARLRIGGTIVRPPPAAPTPPTPPATPPAPALGNGPVVTPGTSLAPGVAVQIEWGTSWYHGTVLGVVAPGGAVRVHYAGYGPEWDETVDRARLRIDK